MVVLVLQAFLSVLLHLFAVLLIVPRRPSRMSDSHTSPSNHRQLPSTIPEDSNTCRESSRGWWGRSSWVAGGG
ncbi:hypothetical protein NEOLEDRAFT_1129774 [Neolentinus lepideus HHB14362 ss-1]|uniref:Uncharacterized protein n=1 Tax=Neolentinus lepideus HHB14362 ss-1 TaxID=1314782 RepID=A0A165UM68_9AGAM|nr:hypothetical protein NEOLEDRAFT_1129774 [Neolentinus lepideus HHB14362 ss-1]